MDFISHKDLEGKHAYLSPSNYHWLNYDDEKFHRVFLNQLNKERGTQLHVLACECIRLGVKLPKNRQTLNLYVNDCIGFRLTPEVVLFYSENCFGTADAIGYEPGLLRVSDLKTGSNKAYMHQLEIYSAIFFLEYSVRGITLDDTKIELRIYQNNDCWLHEPDKRVISQIMGSIISKDKQIKQLKGE